MFHNHAYHFIRLIPLCTFLLPFAFCSFLFYSSVSLMFPSLCLALPGSATLLTFLFSCLQRASSLSRLPPSPHHSPLLSSSSPVLALSLCVLSPFLSLHMLFLPHPLATPMLTLPRDGRKNGAPLPSPDLEQDRIRGMFRCVTMEFFPRWNTAGRLFRWVHARTHEREGVTDGRGCEARDERCGPLCFVH